MNKQYEERKERLLPGGNPRYVRCYDNGGETADRYTVVYTGNNPRLDYQMGARTCHSYWSLSMSANPFWPQGICMHGEHEYLIDKPSYKHLGKKIDFTDLPEDCQKAALSDYVYIWDITDHPLYRED